MFSRNVTETIWHGTEKERSGTEWEREQNGEERNGQERNGDGMERNGNGMERNGNGMERNGNVRDGNGTRTPRERKKNSIKHFLKYSFNIILIIVVPLRFILTKSFEIELNILIIIVL